MVVYLSEYIYYVPFRLNSPLCAEYKPGDNVNSPADWFQVRIASLRSGCLPWHMVRATPPLTALRLSHCIALVSL